MFRHAVLTMLNIFKRSNCFMKYQHKSKRVPVSACDPYNYSQHTDLLVSFSWVAGENGRKLMKTSQPIRELGMFAAHFLPSRDMVAKTLRFKHRFMENLYGITISASLTEE